MLSNDNKLPFISLQLYTMLNYISTDVYAKAVLFEGDKMHFGNLCIFDNY